jgi:hypothetical protein
MNIAIDELNFGRSVSKNIEANESVFGSKNKRSWRVLQTQGQQDEVTWEIEVDGQDGSKRQFPLPDGRPQTVSAWLEQNKDLLV